MYFETLSQGIVGVFVFLAVLGIPLDSTQAFDDLFVPFSSVCAAAF